ncbi:hypothetical protein FIV42_21025 [Persicimonas caeni]|uniref:Uncharacterized protein n=1 Tax=Persicimonas caeni TaxID=2292766 RepID=A0A4Y6PXS5_PERCE|nr:hypothetical protein [Persicimonas caeni]QDG53134.1 hypothetical protein FIV42_21025 [Persicimonas caeni]QED34356.1 hypothetical protein FRD00_21020 [Persicimonas caeni]
MAQRSFSVVVLPDDWDGSLEELAQKMMPVTRRGPNQVLPLLARGAMTLEADLSVEEAGLLQARLNKLGVPARVINEAGDVVSDSAHGGAEASEPKPESKPKPAPKSKPKLKLPKPKSASKPEPEPKPEPTPEPEASTGGEWANVFPDLDEPPKSLDELAGDSDAFGAEPAPKREQDALAPKDAAPEREQDALAPKDAAPEREQDALAPKDAAPEPEDKPQATPPPQPPSRGLPGAQPTSKPKPRPKNFDAGKMSSALRSASGDKPPYAPEGFDDSMSHIPLIAALLSLIAPGAGQVYNGRVEEAREYGVRFALILPWYHSVREAYDYAEKIRTYWAPRPEPGAFVGALKHLAIWWLVAGTAFAALGWVGLELYDVAKTPEAPKITEADVDSAFGEARTKVQMARIAALDGVTAYLDERDRNHKRFTMSQNERAERLFRRGIVFCKNGNYATCASAMKRVSSLSPRLRRDAYRLQAWASVQQSSQRTNEPMPEVSVGSLSDFEQQGFEQQDSERSDVGKNEADAAAEASNNDNSASKEQNQAPQPPP